MIAEWIIWNGHRFLCQRCGEGLKPIRFAEAGTFLAHAHAFVEKHSECVQPGTLAEVLGREK